MTPLYEERAHPLVRELGKKDLAPSTISRLTHPHHKDCTLAHAHAHRHIWRLSRESYGMVVARMKIIQIHFAKSKNEPERERTANG